MASTKSAGKPSPGSTKPLTAPMKPGKAAPATRAKPKKK